MNLEERIDLMVKLGKYLTADGPQLKSIKEKVFEKNKWFTLQFVDLALKNISKQFLDRSNLEEWIKIYHLDDNISSKNVGIVMAGNIPLVGFHDFLCVFISGHKQKIKLSEKDNLLFPYILKKLSLWNPEISELAEIADVLKDCDAFIATGSNNSARYFNYYFGKYPSVIRRNKTSAAILSGMETENELELLADDVHTYFGLGCRNVTSLFVPQGYDFSGLLNSFKEYSYFTNHPKYKNNYDYNLTLLIMDNKKYMAVESIILFESNNIYSPISQLHYSFYKDESTVLEYIKNNQDIQCLFGSSEKPFGSAQEPELTDYADGIDTMQFLLGI
ncbi:MAG: acyl-CoA reductase [Chitinophagaceae bacterium]